MGAVNGFKPSTNGLHFVNAFPHEPDLFIDVGKSKIPIGDAANGLCGGFVYTVIDLWNAKLPPPDDTQPPAEGTPLFEYLVGRLFDSFDLPFGPLEYLALMNPALPDHETWVEPLGHGRAWRMVKDAWPQIKADIDAGRLSPLGLVRVKSLDPTQLGQNHQVLVYGYGLSGTRLTLSIYDPNCPDDDTVRLSLDIGHPDHTTAVTYTGDGEPVYCFFRTPYSFHDPTAIAGKPKRPPKPPKLTVASAPFDPGFDKAVRLKVTAVDASSGAEVAGEVLVDNVPVAGTNTQFTYTFHELNRPVGTQVDIHKGVKRTLIQNYPAGTVRATGYPDTAFSFGPISEQDSPWIKVPANVHVKGIVRGQAQTVTGREQVTRVAGTRGTRQ